MAYLSRTERLTPEQVQALVDKLGPLQAVPCQTTLALPARPRRNALGKAPKTVKAEAGAMLRIASAGLPPQLIAALKHAASTSPSSARASSKPRSPAEPPAPPAPSPEHAPTS